MDNEGRCDQGKHKHKAVFSRILPFYTKWLESCAYVAPYQVELE